jgi:hypothetical protein
MMQETRSSVKKKIRSVGDITVELSPEEEKR